MNYCQNCGAELNSMDKFCPHCGRNLIGKGSQSVYVPERGLREKFFKIEGRLNPTRYVLRWSIIVSIYILCMIATYSIGASNPSIAALSIPITLFTVALLMPLNIRRAHDLGHSGWYVILAFMPIFMGVAELLTRRIRWKDESGEVHEVEKFNDAGSFFVFFYVMIASTLSVLYFMFKSGTPGENEYGANPVGKNAEIPFEDNAILATISKIEEHKYSSFIVAGIFLAIMTCGSLMMNFAARFYTYSNPTQNISHTSTQSSRKEKTLAETTQKPDVKPDKKNETTQDPLFAQNLDAIQKSAAETLISFHKNITEKNFRTAYDCLSYDFQNIMSYDGWVPGFKTTVSSNVSQIRVVSESENFITLAYILTAVDNINGTTQTAKFNGTVELVKEGDRWKIDRIENKVR